MKKSIILAAVAALASASSVFANVYETYSVRCNLVGFQQDLSTNATQLPKTLQLHAKVTRVVNGELMTSGAAVYDENLNQLAVLKFDFEAKKDDDGKPLWVALAFKELTAASYAPFFGGMGAPHAAAAILNSKEKITLGHFTWTEASYSIAGLSAQLHYTPATLNGLSLHLNVDGCKSRLTHPNGKSERVGH